MRVGGGGGGGGGGGDRFKTIFILTMAGIEFYANICTPHHRQPSSLITLFRCLFPPTTGRHNPVDPVHLRPLWEEGKENHCDYDDDDDDDGGGGVSGRGKARKALEFHVKQVCTLMKHTE